MSGGTALLAAPFLGAFLSWAGENAAANMYDRMYGTMTPFHEVRGIGQNPPQKGIINTVLEAGGSVVDFISYAMGMGKKVPVNWNTAKHRTVRGLINPELRGTGRHTVDDEMFYLNNPEISLDNKKYSDVQGQMLKRGQLVEAWIKVYDELKAYEVMPADWRPFSKYPTKFSPMARAFGGSIGQNMPYLVGERGPELMIPDSSGYMLPNTGLRALQAPGDLRAAGGAATINASVTINNPVVSDAADIDKLAEKVSKAQVRTLRAAGFTRPS
jgi:hypothetical protein